MTIQVICLSKTSNPLIFNYDNIADTSSYSMLYNTLDFPAGVVPVSQVTAEDVQSLKSYPTHKKPFQSIQQVRFL